MVEENYFTLIANTYYCLISWIKGIRGLGIIILTLGFPINPFLKSADKYSKVEAQLQLLLQLPSSTQPYWVAELAFCRILKKMAICRISRVIPPPQASCPPPFVPPLRGGTIPPPIKNLQGKPWGSRLSLIMLTQGGVSKIKENLRM